MESEEPGLRHLLIFTALLLAPSHLAFADPCPDLTLTAQRVSQGSAWDVEKVIGEIRHPHHDLVIVTAHRGSWEYCPENTIEGAMLAMDKEAEAVELDVRISSDGVPYLTHDYDLRGEAKPGDPPPEPSDNLIYALASRALDTRWKVDRYGEFGTTSPGGKRIRFETLDAFFGVYIARARLIEDGIVDGKIARGASIILDIKGGETSLKAYKYSDQYKALFRCLELVRDEREKLGVDLSGALIFKINANSAKDLDDFRNDLRENNIPFQPGLVLIVYPPEAVGANSYVPRVQEYHNNYGPYVLTDWQNRYPGVSVEQYVKDDLKKGRGVGAFISYNSFPEGFRVSGGTCFPGYRTPPSPPWQTEPCNMQPLQNFAVAAIEYLFPPDTQEQQATSLTTDWFENATNYFTVLGQSNTAYIRWNRRDQ